MSSRPGRTTRPAAGLESPAVARNSATRAGSSGPTTAVRVPWAISIRKSLTSGRPSCGEFSVEPPYGQSPTVGLDHDRGRLDRRHPLDGLALR